MTLQLYILRQLVISILFALAGIGFMVVPAVAIQAVHRLHGIGMGYVVEYVPLVLVQLVPYLVPMAFLLGVVATFGRIAADNEWTAIRMAGVHPFQVLLPGLLLAVLGSLGTYYLTSTLWPEWKYAQRSFLREARHKEFRALGQGRTEFDVGDFYLSAARRDESAFYEVIISIPRPQEGADESGHLVIVADAVAIRFPEDAYAMDVHFLNARVLGDSDDFFSERPVIRIDLNDIAPSPSTSKIRPKYMTNTELRGLLASGVISGRELTGVERDTYLYEIHRRNALSVTYLLFLLLGAPTGLWLRRGTQLSAFTTAVGYAFLYYVLSMRLGKELAYIGLIGPILGAWTTNGLFLAAGLALMRRVFRR